jgi:hypothetical protein
MLLSYSVRIPIIISDHPWNISTSTKLIFASSLYDIGGVTDMIVVAKFKNRAQLSNFVKKDLALPYVGRLDLLSTITDLICGGPV